MAAATARLLFYINKNQRTTLLIRLAAYVSTDMIFSRFGLQLPELYLLNAEAKARTNDLTGRAADVETLRRNRMPVADAPVPIATAR